MLAAFHFLELTEELEIFKVPIIIFSQVTVHFDCFVKRGNFKFIGEVDFFLCKLKVNSDSHLQ